MSQAPSLQRNHRLVKQRHRIQIDYTLSSLHHEQKQSLADKTKNINRTVVTGDL